MKVYALMEFVDNELPYENSYTSNDLIGIYSSWDCAVLAANKYNPEKEYEENEKTPCKEVFEEMDRIDHKLYENIVRAIRGYDLHVLYIKEMEVDA